MKKSAKRRFALRLTLQKDEESFALDGGEEPVTEQQERRPAPLRHSQPLKLVEPSLGQMDV